MSELINNSIYRKTRLKELILKLHNGESAEKVRKELIDSLQNIPYGEVVEVEQELIQEGLSEQEVLRLCDIHGKVLEGNIDLSSAKRIPEGHPVDIFIQENEALSEVVREATVLIENIGNIPEQNFINYIFSLLNCFNELMDVDKHYQRKEYLVFPYLENNGITGPPKVMWSKHDEIREQLKGCIEVLRTKGLTKKDAEDSVELLFKPTLKGVADMVIKEEQILFPMCMDILTIEDWWNIHNQTMEIGFTLYDPKIEWRPEGFSKDDQNSGAFLQSGSIQLPSGSFTPIEIQAILNTVPVDMTFVDKNDKVRYFTQGKHRIFARNRSIINRDVRLCHPPASVHIVEKILDDFKAGKEDHAPFWINMKGKFIHIEYFAIRNDNGEYLGTLEVSQDLTELKNLTGEQRILSYTEKKSEP